MAISGPKIQMPAAAQPAVQETGTLTQEWATYLHSIQQTAFAVSRSGSTSSRPTSTLDGRWIGMPFFDLTLGKPVFLKSVNPDVWVDGTGAVV